jgi:hypothetical protein
LIQGFIANDVPGQISELEQVDLQLTQIIGSPLQINTLQIFPSQFPTKDDPV